ncbi:MAG: hypothetical protein ACPL25_04145 [Ignavibacteria bacterium]
MKFLILFVASTLFFNFPVSLKAQEEETKKDTTIYIDHDYEINIDEEIQDTTEEDILEFKEFRFRFRKEAHPYLRANYGYTRFAHKNAIQDFHDIGTIDFQLGYTKTFSKNRSYIVGIKDRYLFLSLNNKSYYKPAVTNPNKLSNYQLGLGTSESFGYKFGELKFIFGTGKDFNWTKTSFNRADVGPDTLILDLYRDAVRFGEAYQASATLKFFDFVGINFNYKYGVIFPRHMFWKHLGSFVIEEAAQSLLNEYLEKVFSMRPAAGPIINFILRSSLSYLFYELKKERMNWPFKTTSPLTYDVYTVGLRFTF